MMAAKPLHPLKPKAERLPWRYRMTLCMAAQAMRGDVPCLIAASDLAVETETSSANVEDKLGLFDHRYVVMQAGQWNRALELAGVCQTSLADETLEAGDVIYRLRRAVTQQKQRLAAEYVGGALGITYEEFISSGKASLPEETFRRMLNEIGNMTLDCSLIIGAFRDEHPTLYRIHETGMVELCNHFCAIGSGRTLAEAVMFLRGHNADEALNRGLYHVFEAMRLGDNAPGVSEEFALSVFSMDKKKGCIRWERLRESGSAHMDEQLKEYSLRPLGRVDLPQMETFEGCWSKPKNDRSVRQKGKRAKN